MRTLANGDEKDEMPQNVAFHQDYILYLLRLKPFSEKEIHFYLLIITRDKIKNVDLNKSRAMTQPIHILGKYIKHSI